MNVQNTKAIARKAGVTTAQVNEIARDLGIKMVYRADLRHWDIVDRKEAAMFMDHLLEFNA